MGGTRFPVNIYSEVTPRRKKFETEVLQQSLSLCVSLRQTVKSRYSRSACGWDGQGWLRIKPVSFQGSFLATFFFKYSFPFRCHRSTEFFATWLAKSNRWVQMECMTSWGCLMVKLGRGAPGLGGTQGHQFQGSQRKVRETERWGASDLHLPSNLLKFKSDQRQSGSGYLMISTSIGISQWCIMCITKECVRSSSKKYF